MADVLFTHSNHLYADRKQVRKMQPYPPLQPLIAAGALREQGYEVALFDATLNSPEAGFAAALAEHRPRLVVVSEDNFNFLTKMCLTRNRELAFWMCGEAAREGIPAVVNGSDATDHVAAYLDAGFGFVLLGEVENTLGEVARLILDGEGDRYAIAGLAFRSQGRIHRTARRELIADLDRLPSPAWDLVGIEQYRAAWKQVHGYFSLNLVSSRGCPYRCNWCAKPIYGSSYHFHSAERVAGEMRAVKTAFAPDRLWFADDIFGLSQHWTRRFADAVERLDAQIPFQMQSRCDLMTRDTVDALRRAGCMEVWMGAESGSQPILDRMDKGTRVTDIHQARENLRRHGIRACFFLQFGYVGETWEDIERTVRMLRETRPDDIGVSVSYPLPGTKFYERVAAQLGAKANWSDSDDLAMMFHGAYTSEFYRALADALHREAAAGWRCGDTEVESAWRAVRSLEKTCANARPTVLWTSS